MGLIVAKKPQPAWTDDAAKKLVNIIKNAMDSGRSSKREQAARVVGKATKQATKQGNKSGRKIIKEGYAGKLRAEAEARDAASQIAARARKERLVKQHSRTVNAQQLSEAAGRKGSKLKGGKEIPMSKQRIAEVERQGSVAGSQRAKGNAKRAAEQQDLRDKIKNTKNASDKLRLRRQLRAHEEKHGRFGS
jgi:hypothetical protein